MNASFQQPFMQEGGFQAPSVSGIAMPSDYDLTPQFDSAFLYNYVSSNPSNFSLPPDTQNVSAPSSMSSMDARSVYSNLPPVTNTNLSNMNPDMDSTYQNSQTMPVGTEQWEELARQWDAITQTLNSPPTTNSNTQYSYYPQTATHTQPPVQPSTTTASSSYSQIQQQPQHYPPQTSFPQGQAVASEGTSTSNVGPIRHSRTASGFPQSGSSVGSIYQRRGQRNNASGLSPDTTSHHRVHSSTHARRARQSSAASSSPYPSLYSQQSTAYSQGSTNSQGTAHSQASGHGQSTAHGHGNQAVNHNTSTSSTSRSENQHQPTQSHASLTRTAGVGMIDQSEEWLRHMRPNHLRYLQEHGLIRSSRGDHVLIPPYMHKKMIDTPAEPRPKPKETSELTMNMECKICMDQLVDTVLLPCGHAILCRWCADRHIPSTKGFPRGKASCPMCREPVRQKHRIYFP